MNKANISQSSVGNRPETRHTAAKLRKMFAPGSDTRLALDLILKDGDEYTRRRKEAIALRIVRC